MVEIKVCWARKSMLGREYPFGVPRVEECDPDEISTLEVKPDMIIRVSEDEWDRIAETLAPLDPKFPDDVFIITDSDRWLAVDPQGYDYPRYKSQIADEDKRVLRELITGS